MSSYINYQAIQGINTSTPGLLPASGIELMVQDKLKMLVHQLHFVTGITGSAPGLYWTVD